MGRGRWLNRCVMLPSICVSVALIPGLAQAKAWRKWAAGPLASDSSYAALVARPSDSLTVGQRIWLVVQRDWRAERDAETPGPSFSIRESGHEHVGRRSDAQFAELVSKPYAALSDSNLIWLVTENTAQRVGRASHGDASGPVGALALGLILGGLIGIALVADALSHIQF